MSLIYKRDGNPFPTIASALSAASRKSLKDEEYEAVKVQGGYALRLKSKREIVKTLEDEEKEFHNDEPSCETISPPKENWVKKDIPVHTKTPDIEVTIPYRPTDVTQIPDDCKNPLYVYRFANKHKLNMDKKLRNRWEVDHEVAKKMKEKGLIFINSSCDSTLVVGDMILIKMRRETELSRKKYYYDKAVTGITNAKKVYEGKVSNKEGTEITSVGDVKYEKISAA
jgi:hypothetical protein